MKHWQLWLKSCTKHQKPNITWQSVIQNETKKKTLANSIPKKKKPVHSFLETVTKAKFRYNLIVNTNYYYMRSVITNTIFAGIQPIDLLTFQPVYQPKEYIENNSSVKLFM